MAVSASGNTPPYEPECTASFRVRNSNETPTMPRSDVMKAGTPTDQFPPSPMTMTSGERRLE